MSDDRSTAARIQDLGIRVLYRLANRWQAWLDVEVALARAQADLGMIPREVVDPIAHCAKLDLLDRARIDEAAVRTAHTLVPLVWELARVVGDPANGCVHWGGTTQNITQIGELLVLRQAHRIFLRQLGTLFDAMGSLADRGAEMVIAACTHGQHAVPATFGFKVAAWIDGLLRHMERLRAAEPRIFVAMLGGGAAGTFASFGAIGPSVQEGLAKHLEMTPMSIPRRAIGDHLAEYVLLLGMLGAACGKLGRDVYTLMKTEFGEVEEPMPEGSVGSSTMPQKRNPVYCQDVVACAAEIRSIVPLALEAMPTEHEADRTTALMIREATARAYILTGDMLLRVGMIMDGMSLRPERMRRNLDLSGGLIVAEAVMLLLGTVIGRQQAYDVVHDAAQAAYEQGRSFSELPGADGRVTVHLARAAIDALLDPTRQIGLCADLARQAADRARKAAATLT